ncbi:4-coumarate--CoA ligase [Yangia mangrovi]|uniref:4-coumarate--CoA ligase n=1 Tax=Alloyangia mangrovi TaxID=1779329 RepID=A0A2A3JZZ9_9RHOB|nr:4-coumarate--CoA ligase [Alloyangia mangrovi]MCT4373127.1 4-coumarate--CoA ligase [Alloyangia mangrovi]
MIRRDDALRLCKAVLFDELQRLDPSRARRMPAALWTDETRIDEDGLGFDSLSRIDLVSAMTTRFALHRSGVEDYMLLHPELGTWAQLLETHFEGAAPDLPLAFLSSGSTGTPKVAHHPLENLVEEVEAHAAESLSEAPARVVALVPPHHIYGFLFTVLLPARLGLPVLDLAGMGPGALFRALRPGDLVIGTPYIFGHVLALLPGMAVAAHAVTSTAPAPPNLWQAVARAGLSSLTEIYGASETGGVGHRASPEAPFQLLRCLEPGNPPKRRGVAIDLQDHLRWSGDGRAFTVHGRHDRSVQVAGHNVSLRRVAAALEAEPQVARACVRKDGDRLKCFIVPCAGADAAALEERLRDQMEARLAPAARPVIYTFGARLPRDPMGKLADWHA